MFDLRLGMYFAWVNRDWSAATTIAGFAAAAGGALLGTWLGFNATDGLVALLTTIIVVMAGANLLLLGLNIVWDQRARDRSPSPATQMLEARPSTS